MARPHLEIQRPHSKNPLGLWRTTFRDPITKKIRHKTVGRITGLSLGDLLRIQAKGYPLEQEASPQPAPAPAEPTVPPASSSSSSCIFDPDALQILSSREDGACRALRELAKDIGLDKAIYSRSEQWVRCSLAMIIGRIVYQGSKLALSHCGDISTLWEVCGVNGPIDVNEHCYAVMDRLLERQEAIQKTLAAKHLKDGCLVLYDITSSYLEGEYAESEITEFGYNRDNKRGHKQVVIGLITNAQGCPVAIEVFPGNTQDATTVEAKVRELQSTYGLSDIVLVGDRGMITQSNEAKLKALPKGEELKIISALTHREIVDMLKRNEHNAELFDDNHIIEVAERADPTRRYCLCRNPHNAQRQTQQRNELIERTKSELTRVANTALKSQSTKAPASTELIGSRVGSVLNKTKMGKYITWSVKSPGMLEWQVDEEQIKADQALDGCYVIKTTVSTSAMNKEQVVASYKGLSKVEQAFRNLKTVSLELRPMYHRKDERIEAHAFLCMLAYYLQWHMSQRLEPLWEEQRQGLANKTVPPKERRWTLAKIIEVLKALRAEEVSYEGVKVLKQTQPTADQARVIGLLKTRSPNEPPPSKGS